MDSLKRVLTELFTKEELVQCVKDSNGITEKIESCKKGTKGKNVWPRDKLKIDEYELKAYTLNVINQTKNFLKSFIKGDEIKWKKKNC